MNLDSLILFSRLLILAEAAAAIAGLITWRKWRGTYLKWVPLYLALIVCLELSERLLRNFGEIPVASIIFKVTVVTEMIFIHWFFYKTLHKKIIIAGACIYLLGFLMENFLIQDHAYYFQSLSYTIGNLFILVYLLMFFIELVKSERILVFKKLTVFWIALGMLVFYLGTFPFYGLYNELAKDLDLFVPLAWISTSLNYSMYLLFTIAFIWGKPQ
ncbi:MAG TPA: hypothetical protein PLP23_00545 [Panacibacter sp.]|nr:hypothetical protein [Panacibacter sp.]